MWIAKNNDLIILAAKTEKELRQSLGFMVYTDIEKTNINYVLYDGEYITEEQAEEKEQERINNLTMTPLDFIKVLEQFGVPFEASEALINSRADIRKELTYCQNVYCGVVKSFLPITIGSVTVTAEMVEQAFILKNSEVE